MCIFLHRHFCMIRTQPEFIIHVPKSCGVVPPVTEEIQFTTLPPDKYLQVNSTLNHITTSSQVKKLFFISWSFQPHIAHTVQWNEATFLQVPGEATEQNQQQGQKVCPRYIKCDVWSHYVPPVWHELVKENRRDLESTQEQNNKKNIPHGL